MNLVEISAKIRDHLIKQNACSIEVKDGSPRCLYRTSDGRMCAVGCLISDEQYQRSLEGKTADSRYIVAALLKSLDYSGPPNALAELVRTWQKYHDTGSYYRWTKDPTSATSPEEKHKLLEQCFKDVV